MQRAYSLLTLKSVDDDKRILTGIATTPTVDRVGDIVEPKGAEFNLPIPFLWQHNHDAPVGNVTKARVTAAGIEVTVQIEKTTTPGLVKDRLDAAWEDIKLGLVRGLSIGFKGVETARIDGTYGIRFLKWLWLELSAVTIPANGDASIQTIKAIDSRHRAASGRQELPGVSGQKSTRDKGTGNMKTLEQRIRALEDDRAAKAARMQELFDAAPDGEIKQLADADRTEYRGLVAEIKELDGDIADLNGMLVASKSAAAVSGVTSRSGTVSRAAPPRVTVKELPKGTAFARYAMAVAAGRGSIVETLEYAKRWDSQTPEVSDYIKAAAGSVGNSTWGEQLAEPTNLVNEFIELLMPKTVIGRISGFDMVPFNIRIVEQTGGAQVGWVGEAAAKPVTNPTFGEFTLGINKMAGIVVISDELVRVSRPNAEDKVRNDLVKQITKFMDQQFLNSSITGTSARPAAVTVGAPAVVATGNEIDDFYADLNGAMAPFDSAEIDTSSLHIIMPSSTARRLSTLRNALGQLELPTLTPLGGTILGYPAVVSNASPAGQITLVVANEIAMADDGSVRLDASREATLDMAGGDTPAFSLWQKNAIGIRAERWITYKKKRDDAVTMITGADYGAESSAA